VKLTPEGKVKVLDFGLAKAYAGDTGASSSADLFRSPTLARTGTEAGLILGTASYMSPEQARGRRVDKRTDIWAFGALLFELLTGGRAFAGETFSVYRFRAALPRVFFVNRYEVTTAVQILNNMANRSFDPRDLAYVQEDPGIKVDPPGPDATASVVKFGLQDLTVSATATGNNLLFLSEVWYPEGWKTFIDGQESPILRLNYLFRGVVVPAGKHTIEMKFEPRGFELGKNLSLGVNLVLLVGFGFLGVQEVRKRRAA